MKYQRRLFPRERHRWHVISLETLREDWIFWNYPQSFRHVLKRIHNGETVETPDGEFRLKKSNKK